MPCLDGKFSMCLWGPESAKFVCDVACETEDSLGQVRKALLCIAGSINTVMRTVWFSL